ncbi:MAG: apolipoprotein N-acyltransferase [Bacteroidales bacterium]
MQLRKYHLFLLALLSGLLLSLGWLPYGYAPFLFIGFIPLLIIENHIAEHKEQFSGFAVWGYSFIAFLLWNILTTSWVYNSTPAAIAAFLINAILMSFVIHFYHISRLRFFNKGRHLFLFPIYWIAFEYFHLNWDLSWPWLTLGNGFANIPQWIQWYEYTGVLGGSAWILIVNICLFMWLQSFVLRLGKKAKVGKALLCVLLILLPIGLSFYRYNNYTENQKAIEVVVVQPNIDPYSEQYSIAPIEAVDKMLHLAELKCNPETRFVITPESMIQEYLWEEAIPSSPSVQHIQSFLSKYPQMELIAGLSSLSTVSSKEPKDASVREMHQGQLLYRAHNTALFISPTTCNQKYYKSKLTPGVEIMPFANYLPFIKNWAIDLGGTVGSLGTSKERTVFVSQWDSLKVASIICYESIYGDFVRGFVQNGASLLFIITNDGWWGNTQGHIQHAAYARLRAIENRRSIAQSANTGTSCFINQKGEMFRATNYWTSAVIRKNMYVNNKLTFYTRYGDIIGRVCLPTFLLLMLVVLVYGYIIKGKLRTKSIN